MAARAPRLVVLRPSVAAGGRGATTPGGSRPARSRTAGRSPPRSTTPTSRPPPRHRALAGQLGPDSRRHRRGDPRPLRRSRGRASLSRVARRRSARASSAGGSTSSGGPVTWKSSPSMPIQTATVSQLSAPVTSTQCSSSTVSTTPTAGLIRASTSLGRCVDEDPGVHLPAGGGDVPQHERCVVPAVERLCGEPTRAGHPQLDPVDPERLPVAGRTAAGHHVPALLPAHQPVRIGLDPFLAAVAEPQSLAVADGGRELDQQARRRPPGRRRWCRCWPGRCRCCRAAPATRRRRRSGSVRSSLASAAEPVSARPGTAMSTMLSPTATATASSSSRSRGGSRPWLPSR